MNRFKSHSKKYASNRRFSVSIAIFVVVMAGFIYGVTNISKSNIMNEKEILSEALQRDIVHCYAVEGMYPPSLQYIEDHYGLIYDKKKFIVNYVNEGSNITPSVIIIER